MEKCLSTDTKPCKIDRPIKPRHAVMAMSWRLLRRDEEGSALQPPFEPSLIPLGASTKPWRPTLSGLKSEPVLRTIIVERLDLLIASELDTMQYG